MPGLVFRGGPMQGGDQEPAWIGEWKTPKGVTPPELLSSYEELSAEDTFHDMWDPRGAVSPMKTVPGATDAMRLVQVKSANLNQKWGQQPKLGTSADVLTLAKTMALGENPGASDYERSLVINWESKLPSYLHSASRKLLTYDEIIKDKTTPGEPLRTKYTTSFAAGNILEINNAPGRTFKMLSQSERNTVANFMLSYLWPRPLVPGIQGNQYNVTFDAGPVVIRRLLDSIDVKNLITPQNVADSAATGFNAMKTTTYAFPNTGRVKSNTFTGKYVKIQYVNNGFGPLNPYGFSVVLDFNGNLPGPGGRKVESFRHTLQFSPKQNSGPSVNYLVTSILRVGELVGYAVPILDKDREKSTIIDIAPLVAALLVKGYPAEFIQALLLDLKRIGDHEQIAAALAVPNTLFATIDILCCFMARFVRTPNAWSNNDSAEIWLHRFDTKDLNLFQQFVRDHVAFAQEQLARIKVMYRLADEPGRPLTTLGHAITEFKEKGPKVYYVTSSRWKPDIDKTIREAISLPANLFLGGPSEDDVLDQAGQTSLANSLTTHLLRFKFLDALNYGTELNKQLTTVRGVPAITEFLKDGVYEQTVAMFEKLSALSYMDPLAGTGFRSSMIPALPDQNAKTNLMYTVPGSAPPVSVNATAAIFAIREAFKSGNALIGLCLTDQDIYQNTLFEGTTPQLMRGANNPTFRISRDAFDKFNSAFREFIGLLYPARENTRSSYAEKVDQSLSNFYKQRDAILSSFYDRELAAQLEGIIDIESRPEFADPVKKRVPAANMAIKLQALAAEKRLASDGTEPALEPMPAPAPLAGGGQRGGAGEEQFIDRIEIFREICGMASAYVDSVLTAAYTSGNPVVPRAYELVQTDLRTRFTEKIKFLTADASYTEVVDDISLKWTAGLLNIRETTLDEYGVAYIESGTDKLITGLVNAVNPTTRGDPAPFLDVYGDKVALNDLWGDILLSKVAIEVRTLVLLTILNNWMRPDKAYKYFTDGKNPTFNLSGKPEWNDKLSLLLKTLLKGINTQSAGGAAAGASGKVIDDDLLRLLLPGVVVSTYNPADTGGQGLEQFQPPNPRPDQPPLEDGGWETGWEGLAMKIRVRAARVAAATMPKVLGVKRRDEAREGEVIAAPAGAQDRAATAAAAQAAAAAAQAEAAAAAEEDMNPAAAAQAPAAAAADDDEDGMAAAAADDDEDGMAAAQAPPAAAAADDDEDGMAAAQAPPAAAADAMNQGHGGRRKTHRKRRWHLPKLI